MLVIVLALFAGCNNTGKSTQDEATKETLGYYTSDKATYQIETKYAKLVYPEKWKDTCVTAISSEEPYTVSFKALVEDAEVPVFDVVFGAKPDKGFLVGTLPAENADIDVYIVDHSGSFAEKYPQDKYPELYEMSEDMNEVVSGLIYGSGMKAVCRAFR